jgi:hypothetical protein
MLCGVVPNVRKFFTRGFSSNRNLGEFIYYYSILFYFYFFTNFQNETLGAT